MCSRVASGWLLSQASIKVTTYSRPEYNLASELSLREIITTMPQMSILTLLAGVTWSHVGLYHGCSLVRIASAMRPLGDLLLLVLPILSFQLFEFRL